MSGADISFSYAPGKIILGGEHAVVYGYPAISGTLDRGVRIAVTPRRMVDESSFGPVLRAAGLGFVGQVRPDPGGEGPVVLRKALNRLVQLCGERVRDLEFVVDSAIFGGRGLGSSAALAVAMVRGVGRHFSDEMTEEVICDLALELEKVFHGNPSGVDHTTIAKGGLIWFQRGPGQQSVEPIGLGRALRFAVGVGTPHGGTLQAIQALRERMRRHEQEYKHVFEGIGQLVLEMRDAILGGQLALLGDLLNLNQGYLNALGVSTPELEAMCSIARERGALGAKLTGAGGGGAVIALSDGDPTPIVEAFSAAGYLSFATSVG